MHKLSSEGAEIIWYVHRHSTAKAGTEAMLDIMNLHKDELERQGFVEYQATVARKPFYAK